MLYSDAMGKLRNIVEDFAREYLNSALVLRYDICTCQLCRNDMLAHVLSNVPARYVTTEQGAIHSVIQQTRVEYQAEIARAILRAIDVVSASPRHKLQEDKNHVFQLLLAKIKEDRGLDFQHYHQDLLKRRVAIRMRALGMNSYSDYLLALLKTSDEYEKLFEVLCINVSEFFRDAPVWEEVRKVADQLVRAKKQSAERAVKVWSAGCANGEEAYTVGIVFTELMGANPCCELSICATDVDGASLAAGKKGQYKKESLKNIERGIRDRFFTPDGLQYRVIEPIKKLVKFDYLDLTSTNLVKDTDMVFCRNVFIYFDRSLQEQLLMKFYNSLKPGGYLVLGKAETLISEAKQIFEEINFDARIFRKRSA